MLIYKLRSIICSVTIHICDIKVLKRTTDIISCVCPQFPYRGKDTIFWINFSYCPLPCVLHATLANWQRFGFEFHLRSSPSAYSGFVNISRPAEYFTACYTVLKRPNKVETAVHGCNLAFSLDSIVSLPRQAFYVVSALHHCSLVFLFLADQIFYRSYVDRQHFRLLSFASLCSTI